MDVGGNTNASYVSSGYWICDDTASYTDVGSDLGAGIVVGIIGGVVGSIIILRRVTQ